METKMCIQCGLEKTIDLFFEPNRKNRQKSMCKKCHNANRKKYKDKDYVKAKAEIRVTNKKILKDKLIESYILKVDTMKKKDDTDSEISFVCKKCNTNKNISEFYSSNYSMCKSCCKERTHNRISLLSNDESYKEKERLRAKERYRKIDPEIKKMKDNIYRYKNDFMTRVDISSSHKSFSVPKDYQCHHWNYNVGYELDVIILAFRDHRKVHASIVIDRELLIFRTKDGYLLDTKEKHEDYINSIVK